jgi:hypothetical protein
MRRCIRFAGPKPGRANPPRHGERACGQRAASLLDAQPSGAQNLQDPQLPSSRSPLVVGGRGRSVCAGNADVHDRTIAPRMEGGSC